MNFIWFKKILHRFGLWSITPELDRLETKHKWTTAKLTLLTNPTWADLKDWFESLIYDYFILSKQEMATPEQRLKMVAKINVIEMIIQEIEGSDKQIEQEKKKLENLKLKE